MNVQLTAIEISKSFDRRRVLKNVSMRVEMGRTLVVTGPNGSGKTTLMRILAGLLQPTSGEVEIKVNSSRLDVDERRQAVGFVTPEMHVYHELSPVENLKFFNTVRGLQWNETEARGLLERVGLARRGDDPVSEFSSGMKQRIKLACALVHKPSLMLLDEPGANLDEAGREVLARVIADQRQQGITILATNDAEELAFGDELLAVG